MAEILSILTSYSPMLIFAAVLIAGAVFVIRATTERVIGAEFDRRAKALNLGLERRSRFEEMVLIERYETLNDILARLTRIASDLRRRSQGIEVEGLMRGTDIVPLTEVYELMTMRRHILTERFFPEVNDLAGLLLGFANARDAEEIRKAQTAYQARLNSIQTDMTVAFGLAGIVWTDPAGTATPDQAAS